MTEWLDDEMWAAEREAICRRFLNMDADEFEAAIRFGDVSDLDEGLVESVLSYFPELD